MTREQIAHLLRNANDTDSTLHAIRLALLMLIEPVVAADPDAQVRD